MKDEVPEITRLYLTPVNGHTGADADALPSVTLPA
jgi:hypothetical protein